MHRRRSLQCEASRSFLQRADWLSAPARGSVEWPDLSPEESRLTVGERLDACMESVEMVVSRLREEL